MKSVLFVAAGRHQRRAILRAHDLGLRVVGVDRNPEAPGLAEADVAEVVARRSPTSWSFSASRSRSVFSPRRPARWRPERCNGSALDKVLAFPGVVQADVFLREGETIRPVRLDGDRMGYVIATGETNLLALERAEAAAGLLDMEVE